MSVFGQIPLPGYQNFYDQMLSRQASRNALKDQELKNEISKIELQYAPITKQSEAASKLAYANLMGPQFLAKLMGNTDILANIPEDQKGPALQKLLQAGGMQNFANAANPNNPVANMPTGQQSNNNPFSGFGNFLKTLIMGNNANAAPQNMPAGQNNQGNQLTPAQQFALAYPEVAKAMQDQYAQTGQAQFTIPQGNAPQQTAPLPPAVKPKKTFAENRAEYGKVVKQGEEQGKFIAEALNDMAKEYKASIRLNDSYDEMKNLINDPIFQKMRAKFPFFQDTQMKALSKIGTPYEQEIIGTFKSAAQKILANAVNSFEGRKFVGEFKTTNDMKINENDTFNTIIGKMQAGMLLNNFDQQRVAIASRLMKDKHLDQQEALEIADKQLDRKKIENDIKNLVRITIKNKKTGEIKTIPIHEARKMGVPNV